MIYSKVQLKFFSLPRWLIEWLVSLVTKVRGIQTLFTTAPLLMAAVQKRQVNGFGKSLSDPPVLWIHIWFRIRIDWIWIQKGKYDPPKK
jgi:hypothetical protein